MIEIPENKSTKKPKKNKYDLTGEYGIGWTSNTNEEFYFDLEDYDKIKDFNWKRIIRRGDKEKGYLCTTIERGKRKDGSRNTKVLFFHKMIVDYNLVDHENGNKLDNRKKNLRECTQSQNMMNVKVKKNNTSGVTGVGLFKNSGKWFARINPSKGNRIFLGEFTNKEDAIKARLVGEIQYYGEFAPQKYLYEQYGLNPDDYEYLGN